MKIVYIVSQFPSLTETFVAREIQQVVRLGHDVTICALHPQPAQGPQGLRVPEVRFLRVRTDVTMLVNSHFWALAVCPGFYFSTLWDALVAMAHKPSRALHVFYVWLSAIWLAYRLRTEQIEYIHSHFLHNEAIAAMWLALILNIPYGVTAHVTSIRHARSLIRKVVIRAAFLVGDTEQTLSVYQELSGRQAELIRNGVNIRQLQRIEPRKMDSPSIRPLILAVGSLSHPKGFHILIHACNLLHLRGIDFQCRIVGEGEERSNLELLIEQYQLQGRVELRGALDFESLRKQYSQATMLVMPSIPSPIGSDGLPTVLIEAMAQGIPVIGTRHAGIPDLVRHHQTGLLAEPGNAQMLADYICTYLIEPELRARMASNGRFLVKLEFDLHSNVVHLTDQMIQAVRNYKNALQ